jgi:hypothetical protein
MESHSPEQPWNQLPLTLIMESHSPEQPWNQLPLTLIMESHSPEQPWNQLPLTLIMESHSPELSLLHSSWNHTHQSYHGMITMGARGKRKGPKGELMRRCGLHCGDQGLRGKRKGPKGELMTRCGLHCGCQGGEEGAQGELMRRCNLHCGGPARGRVRCGIHRVLNWKGGAASFYCAL